MDADLRRFYSVDLADYAADRISVRRLLHLVRALPADSWTVRRDDTHEGWRTTDFLLAALLDEQRSSNWMFVQAHKDKSTSNPKPDPVRRPGEQARQPESKPPAATREQMRAWFGAYSHN